MTILKGRHLACVILFSILSLLSLLISSCGVKIPSGTPEKVTVNYEKYLEFPLTNLRFSVKDSLVEFENALREAGLNLEKSDPIILSFATEVSLSPSTFLENFKRQLDEMLGEFTEGLSFQLDVNGLTSSLSGSFTLPELPGVQQFSVSVSDVPVDNLILVQDVAVLVGPNGSVLLSPLLTTLPFEEAIFAQTYLKVTFIPTSGGLLNLSLELDGAEIPMNQTIQNLTIRRSSTLILKNKISDVVSGKLTIELQNNRLSYFKNLDLSRVTENGKIRVDIPDRTIGLVDEDWQLKLSGSFDGEVGIPGFSGNLLQSISLRSGTVNLGSGTGSGTRVTVNVLENYFKIGDGIKISGYLEFSGTVSADLRQPLNYKITPNISIKAVKDYRISITVEKPGLVSYLKFTNDSGYLVMNFSGITVRNATTTFGEMLTAPEVRISFKGVELPKELNVVLEADVTSRNVSYSVALPSGQDIKIERAIIDPSVVSGQVLDVSYPIPQFLTHTVNSLDLDVELLVEYKSRGISISLDLTSNFFDHKRLNFADTGGMIRQEIISKKRTIDLSTFTEFKIKIEPSISAAVEITNVSLRDGAYLVLNPKVSKLEVDNVSLKNVSYDFGKIASVDFGTILSDEIAFLRELDYQVNAIGEIEVRNATIAPVIKLNLSGTEYVITKDNPQNVGPRIAELFKNGQRMDVSLRFDLSGGMINKDSELKFILRIKFPLQMKTSTTDVKVFSSELSGDFSGLRAVLDHASNAKLRFKTWRNTTGLLVKVVIKKGMDVIIEKELSTSAPEISLSSEELRKLSEGGLTCEILIPANNTVQLNYSGELFASPYVAVKINANVEQKLK